jgi:hypothetical protein
MNNHGRYSQRPYYREWDSWTGVLEAAGLDTERDHGVPEEELVDALQEFANEMSRTPTFQAMNERGPYSVWPYLRAFDSWNDALRAAGLSINKEYGVVTGHVDYGSNWPEQRQKAIRRDEWRCQDCGLTMKAHQCIWDGGLHVHHRAKFREFEDCESANRLKNLITLCRECHFEKERE